MTERSHKRRVHGDLVWRQWPQGVDELMRRGARIRQERGLAQHEVADAMGTTQGQVSQMEKLSPRDPFLGSLYRYFSALGYYVTLDIKPFETEDK